MALRLSTGYRNKSLSSLSFLSIFNSCFIRIYTGTQPTTADAAPTGTLLCTFYADGASASAGLMFSAAVSGVIGKLSAQTWSGLGVAGGTAGWFRMYAYGDGHALSTTDARIDGACSTSGAELTMSSLSVAVGALQTISSFEITMPED